MNCEQMTQSIESLNIRSIKNPLSAECNEHLQQCDSCQACYQQHSAYLTKMQDMSTPDLSASAASVMLRNVRLKASEQKAKPERTHFMKGFIAASILSLSVFGSWLTWNHQMDEEVVAVVPSYVTTEVVLVINAPEDIYDADLNIVLPKQVALIGYEDVPELTWPVDLKQGTNTLALPIRVNKNKQLTQPFSIMAKLYHYSDEREFEIKVDLSKA